MSSIGGYKPGDQIGLGTVVNPADIRPEDRVKTVTVDIDLDGKVSPADDKILVKLPPKGVALANFPGFESKEERTLNTIKSGAGGGVVGAIFAGGVVAAITRNVSLAVKFAAVGAVVNAGLSVYVNNVLYQSKLEKAQDQSIPDLVKPKMILNITE